MPRPVVFMSRVLAIEPLIVLTVLIAAATDFWRQKIYNWLTLPAILIGLTLNTVLQGLKGLGDGLLGFGLAFFLAFGLYSLKGIKGGDVKLIAAIGAMGGWKFAIAAMLYTGISGAVLSLWWAAYHGTLRKTLARFVQLLRALVIPGIRLERPLSESDSPPLPYGLAIATGTLLRLSFPTWLPL
ncbi:MAG: prepilin peptidase [Candidatus Sericytochromatia bacterium]|nr:prepilin peptidase [Candidatus Sericytochromatia bacterium]